MRGRARASAIGLLLAFALLTSPGGGVATAQSKVTTRCPAASDGRFGVNSTAPIRHSQDELGSIADAITARIGDGRQITEVGIARDSVAVGLAPGAEHAADELIREYGDAVSIEIAGAGYVPAGCGTKVAAISCPNLVGRDPASADLQLRLAVDTPTIKVGETGRARLIVRNVGRTAFEMDSGQPLVASLVSPGTTRVVGYFFGAIGGTGYGPRIETDQTATIDVVFGAARCAGAPGTATALRPGRYGLRVVYRPEGKSERGPTLLSPQTIVRVTK